MFGPIFESLDWVKHHNPRSIFRKRHLNFITIHYLFIGSAVILGSILIYPAGGLAYIDALFFASGAATQSGLNTVNVNDIKTFQQVVLYLMAMVCNPIFINTFVVFVRLYWFERRFQKVVRDSRNLRRTKSRSRTEPTDDLETDLTEKGVRGRNIVVLRNSEGPQSEQRDTIKEASDESRTESSRSNRDAKEAVDKLGDLPSQKTPTFRREITFADEVDNSEGDDSKSPRMPQRLSPEEHIKFLENQRNPKDKGALRIPGPQDFERGSVPEPLADGDDEDGDPQNHVALSPVEPKDMLHEEPIKRNVTIDEPDQPRLRLRTGTFPKLSRGKSGTRDKLKAAPTEDTNTHTNFLRARSGTFSSLRRSATRDNEPPTPYLSWQPTVGRNSAFVDLTEEQREELGGIEYRSLKTLAVVLVSYFVCFHLSGIFVLVPWIIRTDRWGSVVDEDGLSRTWWGFFTAATLFNDLGFTLTPDSMVSFQKAVVPLLLGSFLIVIGNTGFPCMLRFVIWIASLVVPHNSGVWEEFRFLLDHPRRCFTLLFPTQATWWLFWILVVLNGLDLIFFIVLDIHDSTVSTLNPPGFRVLNGLFQAVSTRTAGTSSVSLSDLHPGIQVSYLIMMYISVFPIAISVRRTNVYEEKSLGLYGSPSDENEDDKEPSYVGAHLRRQLSFDLWYIFLGLFIIAIVEGNRLANTNDFAFTIFSALFEIVSAYGTVGLSLGYPNTDTSFSAEFKVISKLVIIAMQIRGRHRGLPYELDRAILLPSDSLHQKEDEDAAMRLHRRNSSISNLGRHPTNRSLGAGPTANVASASGREIDPASGNGSEHHPTRSGTVRMDIGRAMAGVADLTVFKSRKENESQEQRSFG